MKTTANKKHITILLAVLLVICLVFAGTVLGKYIVEKTLGDKLNLTITGAPQGNTLMVGAEWADYEWGIMSDGFGYRLKNLDGDGENLEKIVFCGKDDLPDGIVTDWDNQGVNVDAADKGNVKAFYDSASKTVYVASKDNEKIGTNKYAACMFQDMTSLTAIEGLDIVDTSKTETMGYMFSGCSALTDLDVSGFDTSNVTSTTYMFADCSELTSLDVSGFNTAKVDIMAGMFSGCSALTELDVSGFDTAAVWNMSAMFSGCSSLTELDVSGFKTGKVETFWMMFSGCSSLTKLDVSGFDTSSAEYLGMGHMFSGCSSLTKLDVSGFDTADVTSMSGMFQGCEGLTKLNLSSFDTTNVAAIDHMFYGCSNLKTIYVSDKWDTSDVVDTSEDYDGDGIADAEWLNTQYVFAGCDVLVGGQGTAYATEEAAYNADPDGSFTYASSAYAYIDKAQENGGTGQKGYFTLYEAYTLISGYNFNWMLWDGDSTGESYDFVKDDVIEWEGWDGDDVNIIKIVFGSFQQYKDELGLSSWDDIAPGIALDEEQKGNIRLHVTDGVFVTDWDYEIEGKVYYVLSKDNSIILANEDCSYMFRNHWTDTEFSPTWNSPGNLCEIAGLELIDTGNVTDMSNMFYGYRGTKSLNLSNFDTDRVTNMSNMFYYCDGLTSLDVSSFDTRNVTNMSGMFNIYAGYYLESLDVSHFDTSNVTDMSWMFYAAGPIKELDVSNFDTSNVTDMSYMFCNLDGLTELDISSFSTESSPIITYMFSGCTELTTIYASELWDPDKVQISYWSSVFSNATKVVGGEGTTHAESAGTDSDNDYKYARIDEKVSTGTMGLFTDKSAPPMGDFTLKAGTEFNSVVADLISSSGATKIRFGSWADYGSDFSWQDGTDVGVDANTIKAFTKDDTVYILSGGNMYANADSSYMFAHAYSSNNSNCIPQGKLTAIDGLASVNTSKVENMSHMFEYCISLAALNVSSFDTSNVTDMSFMFRDCCALTTLDVSGLDTSNVLNMQEMFRYVNGLTTLDISTLDTSNVTNMQGMFQDANNLATVTLNTDKFNTSNVNNMSWMFKGCHELTSIDVSKFDTSKVTTMSNMFNECTALQSLDVSSFNTENVTTMNSMFNQVDEITQLPGIEQFVTTNVTDMFQIFSNCQSITSLDLSNFDTSNVTNMESMFYQCYKLETIYVSELWTTDNVTSNTNVVFKDCYALVGGAGTAYSEKEIMTGDYAHIDGGESNPGYLTGPSATLTTGSAFNTTITNLFSETVNKLQFGTYNAFANTVGEWDSSTTYVDVDNDGDGNPDGLIRVFTPENSDTVYILSEGIRQIYANEDCSDMFSGYYGYLYYLETINGLDTVNTSNVTNMCGMFYQCVYLTTLDVSNFDTSSVTDMSWMFSYNWYLTELDLSSFNTSSVKNMEGMFDESYNLTTLDVSNFDTSSVENMYAMFYGCASLTALDVSHFDTSSVTSMNAMFYDCASLTTLDVSNFVTSSVENMGGMFNGCESLTELDLSSFDTRRVTDMHYMFNGCSALKTIYVSKSWNTDLASKTTNMFKDCNVLVGGEGTLFVSSVNDKTYACIDKTITEGVKGYLTGTDTAVLTTGDAFNTTINGLFSESVTKLQFGTYNAYASTVGEWDSSTTYVGVANAGTIRVFTSGDTVYVLSRGSSEIYANPDSSYMFRGGTFNSTTLANTGYYNIYYYLREINGLTAVNTSKVTNMSYMFNYCSALGSLDLSNFNTSSVTDMSFMFYYCSALGSLDLSSFDTSRVTNMESMFRRCTSLSSLDISTFDTSRVTDINAMFTYCSTLSSLDLSHFDTSRVTNMNTMFAECRNLTLLDISSFITNRVEGMSAMFYYCEKLTTLDVSHFNTSSVTQMINMFAYCSSLTTLDLSSFNTSSVTKMSCMFDACTSLQRIYVSDYWSTDALVDGEFGSSNMFLNCTELVGGEGTTYDRDYVDATYACIDRVVTDGTKGYLTEIPTYTLSQSTFSSVMNSLTPTKIVFGSFDSYADRFAWENGTYFNSDYEIKYFTDNTESGTVWVLSTGKIAVNSDRFFQNVTLLEEIEGLGKLNTSSVTSMWGWFENCSSLTTVDLSGLDTSNVTAMGSMFCGCTSLTSVKLSGIDTSKVKDFSAMFQNCSSLTTLDLSGFDTSSATGMGSMFDGCSSLVTLDLSHFTTDKVTIFTNMFRNCEKLQTIWSKDWDLSGITDPYDGGWNTFAGCSSLKGGSGTEWAENAVAPIYARIDGGESNPGFFTDPEEK